MGVAKTVKSTPDKASEKEAWLKRKDGGSTTLGK
jgi:hypothetical protein